ncbi:MAG: PAS domain S-box protein [Candidatus Aminicenantes bacterium]|nr:MAG: PAS domain S-box protein [Candidatus Aminicenantes bacterium]
MSQEKYQLLVETSTDMIFTVDLKGNFLFVNKAFKKNLGYSKEEINKINGFKLVHPADLARVIKQFSMLLEGTAVDNMEYRYKTKKGSYIHILNNASPIFDSQRNVIGAFGVARNISRRKRMENELQKAHAELERRVKERTAALLKTNKKLKKEIEERKEAEDKLMESEKKYRGLVQNANDAIYIITSEGFKFVNPAFEKLTGYTSKEVCSKGFNFWDIIHPDDIKLIKGREATRRTGKEVPSRYEFRIIAKDRNIKTVEAATVGIGKKGEVKVIGILRDITERTHAEDALRESEEKYRDLIENISDVIYAVDKNGVVTYASPVVKLLFEYSPSDIIGRPFAKYIYKEDLPGSTKAFQKVLEGQNTTGEYRIVTKSGEIRWVRTSNRPTFKGNQIIGAHGVLTDITERKQAEESLKENEEKYRTLIEQSLQAIIIVQDFRIVFANNAFARISGFTVEELLALQPEKVKAMVHSEDHALIWGRFLDRMAGKSLAQHYEYRGIRKDGSVGWLEMYANQINYKGKPAIQAAILDITERKQAEEAQITQSQYNELRAEIWKKASDPSLIEEIDLIQNLLGTVGPVLDVSRASYLRFAPERNAYVTELQWRKKELGSSLGEDISFDIAKLFFGRNYIEIPKDINKIIKIPGLRQTVKLYISSKLKKHHIKSYLVLPYGDMNNPKGLFTFSEQKKDKKWSELEKLILSEVVNIVSLRVEQTNADIKIRASLREKEVLLKEIHHRVKNNMQIISSLLSLQSRNVKEEQTRETFKSTQNRVRSMALIHEFLYESKQFAKINFEEYIRNLTSHLFYSYGTTDSEIKFKINIKDILLDINTAIPCGLIINELITNSLKHAFPDSQKGQINITMRPLNEEEIQLTVSDNGIGLPEDVDFRKTESLGLHLVTILAEDQLKGTIKLDRKGGTKFQIRLRAGR